MATSSEVAADITAVRNARTSLAKGERIDEVWRDGRRLTFGKVTLQGLNDLIGVLEGDLEKAQAAEGASVDGVPYARRPFLPVW